MKPLAALLGVGASLRLLLACRTAVINTDGPLFLSLAQKWLQGDYRGAWETELHPVYPLLIALGGGSEAGGIAVSLFAGVLAMIPLFLLVKELAGETAGLIAAAIYAVHPEFIEIQSAIFQEGMFMLIALSAAYGAVRFVRSGHGIWWATLASSIGWCAKSEGMIVALLSAVTVAWGLRTHRPWRHLLPAALVALLIVGGFVALVSVKAGRLTLSPKSNANQMVGLKEGHDVGEFGLWHDRRREHGAFVTSFWYFGYYAGKAFRVGWLLLAAIALASVKWWGARMQGKAWIAIWAFFYFFCIWFTNFKSGHSISTRYFNPPMALSLLIVGPFLLHCWEAAAARPAWRSGVAVGGLLLAIGAGVRFSVVGRGNENIGFREAGVWIGARTPNAVITSTSDKAPYYARTAMRAISRQPSQDVQYVVVGEGELQSRGWTEEDLRPLVLVKTFPAAPVKRSKIVRVYGRLP